MHALLCKLSIGLKLLATGEGVENRVIDILIFGKQQVCIYLWAGLDAHNLPAETENDQWL